MPLRPHTQGGNKNDKKKLFQIFSLVFPATNGPTFNGFAYGVFSDFLCRNNIAKKSLTDLCCRGGGSEVLQATWLVKQFEAMTNCQLPWDMLKPNDWRIIYHFCVYIYGLENKKTVLKE